MSSAIPPRITRLYPKGTVVYSSSMDDFGLVVSITESILVFWSRGGLLNHRIVDTFTWLVIN